MIVMETRVTDKAQQACVAAEYQSRCMPAERMISPFPASDRAKHSYFPRCIALTIPAHLDGARSKLDGATSKLSTEGFPDPDDVVLDGYVPAGRVNCLVRGSVICDGPACVGERVR
jgi:hypothetical protein